MKKLIPGIFILLILICSCNSKKSFLTQRYTHFKHKKSAPVTETRAYADKGTKPAAATAEIAVVNPEPVHTKPVKLEYTKSVVNKIIVPVVSKGKEKVAGLISSNSKQPVTQLSKVKPLDIKQNVNQKHEKRGLLWGVIDGILAIIVLVVFVMLVVWLVLVLT